MNSPQIDHEMPAQAFMDFAGARVHLKGKFGGMTKRDAAALIRSYGASISDSIDSTTTIVVVGANELLVEDSNHRLAFEDLHRDGGGEVEVISETELWQRLGLVDPEQQIHRLYTPAMLAQLLDLPLSIIRRWHRRGLISPVKEFFKLPYFDFQEVVMARHLAELVAAGVSPSAIESKLLRLSEFLPEVERRVSQLSVIVEGKDLLLRQGDGLLEPGGQLRIDFDACESEPESTPRYFKTIQLDHTPASTHSLATPDDYVELANELEDDDRIDEAIEVYRSLIIAFGPTAEACFQLGDLLLRVDDLSAARERYYMAVELDPELVEARASLACVLQKEGKLDLAISAFQGALEYYPDYPDAHFHLARAYQAKDQIQDALDHWQHFLRLAPTSPWADEARDQLMLLQSP